MKVTQQDIGQWTCYMFTDESDIPKNATKEVSLFHVSRLPLKWTLYSVVDKRGCITRAGSFLSGCNVQQ